MKKKAKLNNILQPPVMNVSSCGSIQVEPYQQILQTGTSEPVLQGRLEPSNFNEATHAAVVVTELADVSDKINQIMPSLTIVAASKSSLGFSPRRSWRSWCYTCQRVHNISEFLEQKCRYSKRYMRKIKGKCAKAPQDVSSPSGRRTVTDGSSCKSMHEEPSQQSLQTRATEQVLQEKANHSDVIETLPMAVVATKSADVSNKTSPTMPRYVLIETDQQQKIQMMPNKELKPSSVAAVTASGSRRQGSWCHRCQVPSHANSECDRLNRTCFKCHEKGHFAANCPNAPQDTICPNGTRTATPGGNTGVHALLTGEHQEETDLMLADNRADLMQVATVATSGSRKQWCRRCRVPTHAESECDHCNRTCFKCHGKEHFAANCPNATQNTIHPSGLKTDTAGDNTMVHALLAEGPQEETDSTLPKLELT